MNQISVLVADDEQTVRETLQELIASDRSLRLVGAADEAESAIELALSRRPDVALLDVRMPGGGGTRAAREIVRSACGTKIIALSAFEDPGTVTAMVQAGASTYIAKSDPADEILDAIHRVVRRPDVANEDEGERIERALSESSSLAKSRSSLAHLRRMRVGRAIRPGGVLVRLRPIIRIGEPVMVGAEAIPHVTVAPDRPAEEWLAEAQAVGRLVPLELAVVRAALGEIERHLDDVWVSIPISGETLQSDALRQTLEPAPAQRVVLQLSQQAPFDGSTAMERSLLEYRHRGFRLSLTETWAEVASLRHLVHLRPDFVRIDRELTREVADDEGKQAVLRTLAVVASDLGAVLVAEDVASEEHAAALADLGVQLGCGAVKDVVDLRD